MRSRLIPQPKTGTTLRVRVVCNAEGHPVFELTELVRAERDDTALQVVEGGRVHLSPDAVADLLASASGALAEHRADEKGAKKNLQVRSPPRLKRMPMQPPPSRPSWAGGPALGEF